MIYKREKTKDKKLEHNIKLATFAKILSEVFLNICKIIVHWFK